MTYSKEFLDLYNNLFALIPYPDHLAQEVVQVAELWKEFCKLPLEVKRKFTYPTENEDWHSGYIHRTVQAGHDDKEYYHFQPNHSEFLGASENQKSLDEYPIIQEFFNSCDEVVIKLYDFILDHTYKLAEDNEHLANLPAQFVQGFSENYALLRFLHYTPEPDSEVLAKPHFDIGGMTFHVYENSEGLQFLDYENKWRDAPLVEGSTVMFNAYGLESMSGEVLQRTWHRVVRKDGMPEERFSAVFFADFPDNPNWDTTVLGRAKFQPMEYQDKKAL